MKRILKKLYWFTGKGQCFPLEVFHNQSTDKVFTFRREYKKIFWRAYWQVSSCMENIDSSVNR